MNKFGLYIVFLLAGISLQSCSKNYLTSPVSTDASTNLLSAYATIGTSSNFDIPAGIQYFNGSLWVADWSTCLQKWATVGSTPITTVWTYNSGVSFTELNGVGVDPATGNVYACDESNNQIVVFNSSSNFLAVFGNAQMSIGGSSSSFGAIPGGVAVNSSGTTVYALGLYSNSVYVYLIGGTASNPTYTYQYSFGNTGSGAATLSYPYNLRVDNAGNLWIADNGNRRIAKYSGAGSYLKSFMASGPVSNYFPADVLIDGSGYIYGLDTNEGEVFKYDQSGNRLGQFGKGILSSPGGIAADGSGNFFVTNQNPQQIVVFH